MHSVTACKSKTLHSHKLKFCLPFTATMAGGRGYKKTPKRGTGAWGCGAPTGVVRVGKHPPITDTPIASNEVGPSTERIGTRISNKSVHPAQIIIDNKQKQRTPAQVQADNLQKKIDAVKAKQARIKEYQDKIVTVAAFEGKMQQEALAKAASQIHPDLHIRYLLRSLC